MIVFTGSNGARSELNQLNLNRRNYGKWKDSRISSSSLFSCSSNGLGKKSICLFVGGISGFYACAAEEFNEQRSNKETKSLDYDCFTPNFFVRGGGGKTGSFGNKCPPPPPSK